MRGGRITVLAFLAAMIAVAAATGVAVAGSEPDPDTGDVDLGTAGALRYSSDSEALNLANSGYARAVAGCGPDDWHLVGGGAKISGPNAKHRRLQSTLPYDWYDGDAIPEDGYTASGYGDSAGDLKSFGICKSEPQPAYLGGSVPDSPEAVRSFTEECGGGDKVVGGGGSISPSDSFQSRNQPTDGPDANEKADDAWAIRVYDGVGGIGGMSLWAVCDDLDPDYRDAAAYVKSHDSASSTANCPDGTHVSGGGARMSGPGEQVYLAGSYPIDDGDSGSTPDDGWKASGFNKSAKRRTLTAYAICLG
jgi:hypothetical protein